MKKDIMIDGRLSKKRPSNDNKSSNKSSYNN